MSLHSISFASRDFDVALVLSGGNALGAYHAGAWEALAEAGLEPDWIAGASAGALSGAILCGNPPERRLDRFAEFWRPGVGMPTVSGWSGTETARRSAAAVLTLAVGQPDVFLPRHLVGSFWNPFGKQEPASLFDTAPLGRTLERLIDFNRLNAGVPRFSITAVDLETGEDVMFDTRSHHIGVDHLRASAALVPAFPPVEIGNRLLGDAGLSANLPLDLVLSKPPERPLLVLALDLLPLEAPRPRTLGEAVNRSQDLMFATQSRRAILAWQAIFDARLAAGAGQVPAVTLIHLAYADQGQEVSGKAFDFSPASVEGRWAAGRRDVAAALAPLRAGELITGEPGLTVYRPDRDADAVIQRLRHVHSLPVPVLG